MAGHESSVKAIFYAFLANLGIALAKGGAAFYTGSGSMLAEAVHSLADCTNQLLLFLGINRSKRPPTDEHPLGFGKAIYFWSFIVAVLLFSMGGLFSIYEGIHKISQPEGLNRPWIAVIVLFISIFLEGGSLFGALREIKKIRGSLSIWQWLRRTRRAELIVVFGEDVGALIGLSVALAFIALSIITGNPFFDALGSIAIGAILIVISFFLITRMKSLLIGRAADPDLRELIGREIAQDANITGVFHVITMQFGPQVMLVAKIKLKSGLEIDQACGIINRMEERIHAAHPEVVWSFIEPDVRD